MFILKELSLLILIFIYIGVGLILHFLINLIQSQLRYRIISNWTKIISVFLRKISGIKIILEGKTSYLKEKGNFIIANHVSYLDGVVLASLFPVVFVSKLAVKSWPLLGWMSQIGNTIFINRQEKSRAIDSLEEIAERLKNKVNILLFPEGTSTNGTKILPFQSIFFQAPLNSGSSIIPITIQYTKINSQELSLINRDRVLWYGQINLFKHLRNVLKLNNIEVKVAIHPKVEIDSRLYQPDLRKQVSDICRQTILNNFSFISQ